MRINENAHIFSLLSIPISPNRSPSSFKHTHTHSLPTIRDDIVEAEAFARFDEVDIVGGGVGDEVLRLLGKDHLR